MDITRTLKTTIFHVLIMTMLMLPSVSASAAPQQADITKPTRERVKSTDNKSADKTTTSKKDDKKNTTTSKKEDKKNTATSKKDDKKNTTTSKKDDKKNTTTSKKDDKKDAATPKKEDKKDAATPKKDDKAAVAPKNGEKNVPATLLSDPNKNKTDGSKPVQDTTDKAKAVQTTPKRPPVNTETIQFDGIDVSKHQGTINWEELKKNQKIKFVYIKATEGSDYVDPLYKENIRKAKENGFKVGSYHFLTNRSSATNQFNNFVRNVNRTEQDLLPIIDVEECGRWSSQQLRDSLKVFADLLEDHYGCKPVIYTSEKFFIKHLGRSFSGYPLFIAKYNSSQPEIGYKWVLWQFSDRGYFKAVRGNRGEVDLSRFNKGYSINDIIYKPGNYKPKPSVRGAVDHKEKPLTINPNEQDTKDASKQSSKKTEQQKKAEQQKRVEQQKKDEQQKKEAKEAKAKEQSKKKAQEEANRKAKEKEETAKKEKQKAEQQKREKERQEAAQKAAEEKAKRKADAQKARQEKAKQNADKGTNKSTSVRGALTQSQRNDSIRAAQQSGRKINKSSADND